MSFIRYFICPKSVWLLNLLEQIKKKMHSEKWQRNVFSVRFILMLCVFIDADVCIHPWQMTRAHHHCYEVNLFASSCFEAIFAFFNLADKLRYVDYYYMLSTFTSFFCSLVHWCVPRSPVSPRNHQINDSVSLSLSFTERTYM